MSLTCSFAISDAVNVKRLERVGVQINFVPIFKSSAILREWKAKILSVTQRLKKILMSKSLGNVSHKLKRTLRKLFQNSCINDYIVVCCCYEQIVK